MTNAKATVGQAKLSPALQRKVTAISTLRYSVNRYRNYVDSDPDMYARLVEIFNKKGANDVEVAKSATRLTAKAIDALSEEIESNAVNNGYAVEVDGIVTPIQKAEPKKQSAKKQAEKQPAKQAAQTKPAPPPAEVVKLPEEIIVPTDPDENGKVLIVRREPEISTLEDLEQVLAKYVDNDELTLLIGFRWTEKQIKSHYMRINRQPAPPNFHDNIDLTSVLHIQRPCEVDGKEQHRYRHLVLCSIYTDGIFHLNVAELVRDVKLGYFAVKHDNTTFYFDIYIGGYEALPEEKPKRQAAKPAAKKTEPVTKDDTKKKAPPKKK